MGRAECLNKEFELDFAFCRKLVKEDEQKDWRQVKVLGRCRPPDVCELRR